MAYVRVNGRSHTPAHAQQFFHICCLRFRKTSGTLIWRDKNLITCCLLKFHAIVSVRALISNVHDEISRFRVRLHLTGNDIANTASTQKNPLPIEKPLKNFGSLRGTTVGKYRSGPDTTNYEATSTTGVWITLSWHMEIQFRDYVGTSNDRRDIGPAMVRGAEHVPANV